MDFCFATRRAACARVLVAVLAILGGATVAGAEPLAVRLANGIVATVHRPADLRRERTVRERGRLWLDAAPGLRYELVTDVADPLIPNKGDGRFHPMNPDMVVAALADIQLDAAGLAIEVFILPYPRREILDSSAREGMILLSPGVRECSEYAVHFTVAHEVGHVYQYRWMPDSDTAGWRRYNALRQIGDSSTYHAGAAHANRPHEIFAEDFRFLFGGETSNYSGGIENEGLVLPDEVADLDTFLRELCAPRRIEPPAARVASSPNPFNPRTEIQVQFTTKLVPDHASVRVVDAGGREVRRLFDAAPPTLTMRLPWDGRDECGTRVASGLYFAKLDCGGASFSTKLLLVK
jgi:hypothetical protein